MDCGFVVVFSCCYFLLRVESVTCYFILNLLFLLTMLFKLADKLLFCFRAVCETSGHLLPKILTALNQHINSPYEAQRAAVVAFYSEVFIYFSYCFLVLGFLLMRKWSD